MARGGSEAYSHPSQTARGGSEAYSHPSQTARGGPEAYTHQSRIRPEMARPDFHYQTYQSAKNVVQTTNLIGTCFRRRWSPARPESTTKLKGPYDKGTKLKGHTRI